MIPLSDYNQTEGKNVKLNENEILLYHRNHKNSDTENKRDKEAIQLGNSSYTVTAELDSLTIAKRCDKHCRWLVCGCQDSSIITSCLKDVYESSNIYEELKEYYGKIQYSYSFDLNGSSENRIKTEKSIQEQLQKDFTQCSIESRELSRKNFYELYGGFLFIGIFLGIIFLMATTLIIYYKQISEGYEDKERFAIMEKVGMSQQQVRTAIRSQVRMVFFLPPSSRSIIHLAASFKMISKLMAALGLQNIPLFALCCAGTVAAFAVGYFIIYHLTARTYYQIVR